MAKTATRPAFAVGDAVVTPDALLHAVTAMHGKNAELACGLLAAGKALRTPTEQDLGSMCPDCAAGRKAEPTPAPEPEPIVAAAPEPEATPEPTPEPEPEPADEPAIVTHVANQPTREAMELRKVGLYTLEQPKKDGPWRLRDGRDGKLDPHGFEQYEDAAWFAQRRTRLILDRGGYVQFGGTRPTVKVKVPSTVGPYTIEGELKAVKVLRDGVQVGPTWVHPSNGKRDALRWVQRLMRPTRAAS